MEHALSCPGVSRGSLSKERIHGCRNDRTFGKQDQTPEDCGHDGEGYEPKFLTLPQEGIECTQERAHAATRGLGGVQWLQCIRLEGKFNEIYACKSSMKKVVGWRRRMRATASTAADARAGSATNSSGYDLLYVSFSNRSALCGEMMFINSRARC
jgi:hypothetical protein